MPLHAMLLPPTPTRRAATGARTAGIAAGCAGALLGAAAPLAPVALALPRGAPPLLLSLATAALLVAGSLAPQEATAAPALGAACGCVGLLLGYGTVAAAAGDPADLAALVPVGGPWDACRLPLFVAMVMLFHAAEFLFVAVFHPGDLCLRSLMLAPVPRGGYAVAMTSAMVEFWLEARGLGRLAWTPGPLGRCSLVLGAALASLGWAVRTAALFTAKANFTHIIACQKETSHVLVTHGVYRWCRHPGYVGWFVWAVSTQLILGNALSLCAFAAVAWRFFATRIPEEEDLLVSFFGEEYLSYARRVPCGLPYMSALDR